MKESKAELRLEKIRKLKDEITEWQTILVGQQMRISRLEVTTSSLVEILNRESWLTQIIRRISGRRGLIEELNELIEKKMTERRAEFEKQQQASREPE